MPSRTGVSILRFSGYLDEDQMRHVVGYLECGRDNVLQSYHISGQGDTKLPATTQIVFNGDVSEDKRRELIGVYPSLTFLEARIVTDETFDGIVAKDYELFMSQEGDDTKAPKVRELLKYIQDNEDKIIGNVHKIEVIKVEGSLRRWLNRYEEEADMVKPY